MTPPAELRRDWWFTPGAEWILWDDPATGKIHGFRVILTEEHQFLEWQSDGGLSAGRHDDGERPGRTKSSPILLPERAALRPVAERVLEFVKEQRRMLQAHPPPPAPARRWNPFAGPPPAQPPRPVMVPEEALNFIEDCIRELSR